MARTLVLGLLALLALRVLGAGGVARAEDTDTDLQRGIAALRAGHAQEAVDALEAAYRVEPKPLILLDLGIAYTNLGRVHNALDAFDAYVRYADAKRFAGNIHAVRAEMARIRAASAQIRLQLSPSNAQLTIDGAALAPRDGEVLALAGSHRITVSAPGFASYDQVVQLPAGKLTLQIRLRSDDEPVPAASTAAAAKSSSAVGPAPQPTAAGTAGRRSAQKTAGPTVPGPCLLGEVCLGPTLDLGPPNVIGGGLQLRFGDYFGAGFDVQALPSITLEPATASATLVTVDGRIYPFGGSFFLAGGFAVQTIRGSVDNGQVNARAHVSLPSFFTGIGFMGHDGLVLGIDLGVLIPLASKNVSTTFTRDPSYPNLTTAEVDRVKRQATNGVKSILDVLPVSFQLNLVRVGYAF